MKVQITFINTHSELARDMLGYRFTFKYSNDTDEPLPLNECSCGNKASWFSNEFFSMEGLYKECFPSYTKIQTYRYNSGVYPNPFNGSSGRIFYDDTDDLHVCFDTLIKTCASIAEAVHEITTVCYEAYEKLQKYAKEYESKHKDVQISFIDRT